MTFETTFETLWRSKLEEDPLIISRIVKILKSLIVVARMTTSSQTIMKSLTLTEQIRTELISKR